MEKILFNKEQIEKAVENVAIEISQLIREKNMKSPTLMCVLDGAFRFYADIVKQIKSPIVCDFIKLSSYSGNKQGRLTIDKYPKHSMHGKDIIIIDDIFDTGNTLNYAILQIMTHDPKSITAVTLLNRRKNLNKIEEDIIYINGLIIDDEWVAGYGMDDFQGTSRNLNYIYQINNEENGN